MAYQAEDIELANTAEFWHMIQERRSGRSVSLAEVKARLAQKEPGT